MPLVIPNREVEAAEACGKVVVVSGKNTTNGFGFGSRVSVGEEVAPENGDSVSSESSSIGEESSLSSSSATDGDRDEEEVVSKLRKEETFGSLASLEESLPIKRGLSNFFNGKSKSYTSLSDAATSTAATELAKPENLFNKRRRIIMASKSSWRRRPSRSSLNTVVTMPSILHTLEEGEEEEEKGGESPTTLPPLISHERKFKSFKSPRSFSLTDLNAAC